MTTGGEYVSEGGVMQGTFLCEKNQPTVRERRYTRDTHQLEE